MEKRSLMESSFGILRVNDWGLYSGIVLRRFCWQAIFPDQIFVFNSLNLFLQREETNNLYISVIMDHYEKLWQESFPSNQMVTDWDTFILQFSKVVLESASVSLSNIQKRYISGLVDPKHTNQVYKNAYLLFVKNFWNVASDRTKFLSMKLNLSNIVDREESNSKSEDKLLLEVAWKQEAGELVIEKYEVTSDVIRKMSSTQMTMQKSVKDLRSQNFISIGSSPTNDIVIDSMYCNPFHAKIIHQQFPKKPKPSSIFQKETVQQFPSWYIRDVSRSSRLKYWINDLTERYTIVKKGMLIEIGLRREYLLQINSSEEPSKEIIENLAIGLNGDRFDLYGGEPRPIKDIIDFDFTDLTPEQVICYFDEELYYPKEIKSKPKRKNDLDQDDIAPIKMTLIHKPTSKRIEFDSKIKKTFTVGRQINSDLTIDSISIRDQECIFEYLNGTWVMRAADVKVYLAQEYQIQTSRNSNRQKIISGKEQIYEGDNFHIKICVVSNPKNEQTL